MLHNGEIFKKRKSQKSPQNFTRGTHSREFVVKCVNKGENCRADACFHFSLTLPLYLHLILPIQPFYIFITGVGNAKTIRAISGIWGRCINPQNTTTHLVKKKKKHFPPFTLPDFSTCTVEAFNILIETVILDQFPYCKASEHTSKRKPSRATHHPHINSIRSIITFQSTYKKTARLQHSGSEECEIFQGFSFPLTFLERVQQE